MTTKVGPVPMKADNKAEPLSSFPSIGSRCAGIHDGPASDNDSHNEAGYTTANDSDRLQRFFVSTCGRSPYTLC